MQHHYIFDAHLVQYGYSFCSAKTLATLYHASRPIQCRTDEETEIQQHKRSQKKIQSEIEESRAPDHGHKITTGKRPVILEKNV